MHIDNLIYDIEINNNGYCIYISDLSDDILEYIKKNFCLLMSASADCKIYKKDYCKQEDIYEYKIYFDDVNDRCHEKLIVYLRNNNYKYANSIRF
jgi:hypothetical protein